MKTKDKIIVAAISLYNEKGLSNVTSRHIATSIKISHGNLEYHFPNKEALLLAIYEQMRAEVSSYYSGSDEDIQHPIAYLHRILVRLEEFQSKYKFFNLDVLEISRNFEKVNALLKDTLLIRKNQMTELLQKCVSLEYMKPEPREGFYNRLQHTIRILITFWNSQEVVLSNFDLSKKGEMVRHIWDLITPHFTPSGLAEYRTVIEEFSKPEVQREYNPPMR